MYKRSSGFTLIEAVFSLLLVSMILLSLNSVLGQAVKVKKNTATMDQSSEIFHALQSLKADAMASLEVLSPSPGGSGNALILNRVDPRQPYHDRIDTSEGDENFFPYQADERVQVSYELEDGELKRFYGVTKSRVESLIPAESFQVTRSLGTPGLLTLSLETKTERVTKKHSLKVALNP